MAKYRAKRKKLSMTKVAIIAGVIAVIGVVVYFGFASKTSVLPTGGGKNFSLKVSETSNGIAFVSVGTQGRKSLAAGHNSPTFDVNKGDTVTIHIISEIHGDKYDFIIPELNVHSKAVGYFEADTISFVADKTGELTYTSTGHPDMKGQIVVQ